MKLGVARLGIVGGVDRTRGSFMGRSDVPDVEGRADDDGEGVRVAGVPSAAAGESALGDGAGGDAGEGGVGEGPDGDRGGVGGGEDAGFGGVPPRARRGAGESDEGGDALQGRAVASRGGVRGGGGGGVDGGGAVGETPYRAAVVGRAAGGVVDGGEEGRVARTRLQVPDFGVVREDGAGGDHVPVAVVRQHVHMVVPAELLRADQEQRLLRAAHGGDAARRLRVEHRRAHSGMRGASRSRGRKKFAGTNSTLVTIAAFLVPRIDRSRLVDRHHVSSPGRRPHHTVRGDGRGSHAEVAPPRLRRVAVVLRLPRARSRAMVAEDAVARGPSRRGAGRHRERQERRRRPEPLPRARWKPRAETRWKEHAHVRIRRLVELERARGGARG